jgi:radical SAM superfamily enzyme YgiQ (UPF0313 family)
MPVEDLDTLPLVNYRLLEGCENLRIVPIMTSRGCPFQCSFCSVTKVFGRKYRMQSPQRILEEIESILRTFRNKGFFFYDDNLTADKKRISELCDLLDARGYRIRWTAQVRADLAKDPALVAKMARAGLRWVYIGFESINDETLKELKKSQTRADIEKSIRTFHEHGVNIHGMFMFGDDHDTEESISQTVQFAIGNGIDTVQFMLLTPLPGTEHYFKIEREQRLLHKDWDYYNGMFVVFRPKNMSPSKLTHETIKAYRKFYSSGRSILDGLSMISTIFMDALVWNWGNAGQYDLDIIFKRGGAKLIVDRQTEVSSHYLAYLDTLEREEARKR